MNKDYQFKNLRLTVKDRESLPLTDQEFTEELRTLVDWKSNLARLHEADPELTLTITLDAKLLAQRLKRFSRDEGSFWFAFHEYIDSLLFEDLKKRNISLDKLHYGTAKVRDTEYAYSHVSAVEYEALRSDPEKHWYKVIAILPPYRMGFHKNVFYVPGHRLHEFLDKKIYAEDDRHNKVVHIEPLTAEAYQREVAEAHAKVEQYRKEKYRIQ
ncbi:MAG: hypothetical protein ACE5PO_01100 [Candidatus Bathyarchaeia archaeon]